MKLEQYVVDAFSDQVFHGNPAAVCVLDHWLPDRLMSRIAQENNLSETAFTLRRGEDWELRWFTPGGEIDLCGHATLGTAFVLMQFYGQDRGRVCFRTQSGLLTVTCRDGLYEMDFPAYELRPVPVTSQMAGALGARPAEAWQGRDLLCVFDSEKQVRALEPDMDRLLALDGLLVHATAPGGDSGFDCVSRSFAPKLSVEEDPVCGSGHCHIVPYWAARLGRREITACQASRRGGVLYCKAGGERVMLAGKAVLYARSELYIPDEEGEA